jgi:hypothetical protein
MTHEDTNSDAFASRILIGKGDHWTVRLLDRVLVWAKMPGMRQMFRLHPYLSVAFVLSTLVAIGFLVNAAIGILGWEGNRPGPVRPWMTVGLVAENWGLEPREIDAAAGLPVPVDGRPFTLQEIADQRGVPVEEIIQLVEDTVRQMRRAEHHGGTGNGAGE